MGNFQWIFFILTVVIIATEGARELIHDGDRDYGGYEGKLRQDLLGNRKPFDVHTRPSIHSNQSTHLDLGVSLISIVEVNAIRQSVTANIWIRMIWYDYNLHWDEEDYGGINVLRIPPTIVWKPDVLLLNSVEASNSFVTRMHNQVLAYPDGQVLWVPSVTFESACVIDLTYFPFDEHICTWTFRSWSLESKDLKIDRYSNKNEVDLADLSQSGEWQIESRLADNINATDVEHKRISYSFHLKRRGSFYVATLLLPIVMSWLLLLLFFWLPLWTGQRLLLSLLTLLFLQVILLQINYIVPTNGSCVPRIVILCSETFVFAALAVVFSVLLLTMVRSTLPPALSICITNALTGWLGKLLCLGSSRIRGVSLGARLLTSSQVDVSMNSAMEKKEQDDEETGGQHSSDDWTLLATAINRILFLIYFVVFGVTLIITVIGI